MTSRFRFLSSRRSVLRTVASLLLVFTLCAAASDAFAQPPRRPGGDNNAGRGGRGDRGGRGERGGRGGDNNGGRGERGGRPDFPGGGFPGQPGAGFPGMPGGGFPGQPGEGGPGQPGQPGQEGQEGQPDQPQPKPERKVDLDAALDSSLGTVPIPLNQDSFRTRDGARLTGTYLKGKGDKDTPVVILVPGLDMEEGAYNQLGQLLAQQGYGVLIPDLRNLEQGQNRGPRNRDNNPPNDAPQVKEQKSRHPSNRDVSAMINVDREVWFNFLFHVNDKGLCNVKKTIIVGSEFGAALACAWAKNDWGVKGEMGQNVVGLALLSPDAVDDKKKSKDDDDQTIAQKYDCLKSLESVHKLAKGKTFGYLIVAGANVEEKLNAAQLIQRRIGGAKDEKAKPQDKVVLFYSLQTSMQGTQLLGLESLNVAGTIGQFVAKRMSELPTKRGKWSPINEDLTKEDKEKK